MSKSLLSTWEGLTVPLEGKYSTKDIHGTNAWIFKDHEKSMGLLLSGIRYPSKPPRFENITIKEVREKLLVRGRDTTKLRKCLEVHLDPSCDPELLLRILDGMQKAAPDGHYSAELLLDVMQQVIELVRKPPKLPTKEDVIGAWGEMELLRQLVSRASTPVARKRIIAGWEANGSGRDILDLRFPYASGGTAIEVKTSTVSRIHHINGMGQVTVPEGYAGGFLASMAIREGDLSMGQTTADLLKQLEELATGSEREIKEYLEKLAERIELRGEECKDDRFHFFSGEGRLRIFDMALVPKPTLEGGVLEVEWIADLSSIDHLNQQETDSLFASISGSSEKV